MKISVCGKRAVSFKDQNTGEVVQGLTYYYLSEDPNVDGYFPDKIFVRDRFGEPFRIGYWYSVSFNRYGKIDLSSVVELPDTH